MLWIFYLLFFGFFGWHLIPLNNQFLNVIQNLFLFYLIVGWMFYVLGHRNYCKKNNLVFKKKYYFHYLWYLIPAMITSYVVLPYLLINATYLIIAFYFGMIFQSFFYVWGFYQLKSEHTYKVSYYIPQIIFIISSLIVASIMFFVMQLSLDSLKIGFYVALFFYTMVYFSGFYLLLFLIKVEEVKRKIIFYLPLIVFLPFSFFISRFIFNFVEINHASQISLFLMFILNLYAGFFIHSLLIEVFFRNKKI